MPNLDELHDNPEKRAKFVASVLDASYERKDVVLNEGVTKPEQLQELVCKAAQPFPEYDFRSDVTGR